MRSSPPVKVQVPRRMHGSDNSEAEQLKLLTDRLSDLEERRLQDEAHRRHYEGALRESEDRFSKTFRLAPIALSISTLEEGRYLDVNDALLEITGYARHEIVGHTASELKVFPDPDDGPRIRALLAGGQPVRNLELRLRGKNGDIRTSLLAADIFELKDTRCLLTASVDITERKEREATLQFLDALGKETAPIADADAILAVTTRMLAEHLGVAVCAYADMDGDEDGFTIRGNWSDPGSMSILGHYSLAAFGKLAVTNLHAGIPLILNDNRAQLPPEEAATFLNIGLAATICMPLVKEGRLTALMAIHDRVPRAWTARELSTLPGGHGAILGSYRARKAHRRLARQRSALPGRGHHRAHRSLGNEHGHADADLD